MPIKPPRTVDIRGLIAALASDDDVGRESAIARLAVIGGRAVDRLAAAYPAASRDTRIAILRALEAIGDPRGLAVARGALGEGGDVAVAAASSLRPLLESADNRTAAAALDALVETALDPSAERRVRMTAFDALRDMPPSVRDRVAQALQQDAGVEALAQGPAGTAGLDAAWQDVVDGRLPEDPAGLREAVQARVATAPLGVLQKTIDAVRGRESEASSAARRDAWREVRGAIHQALALRGSRVAVYDLRETLEGADGPLPATFLAALHLVGDESCLEPVAAAWTTARQPRSNTVQPGGAATVQDGSTRGDSHGPTWFNTGGGQPRSDTVQHGGAATVQHGSTRPDDGARWRQQLEAAFQAIATRSRLSKRGAVWKRLQARYPDAVAAFSTTWRTTPRPTTRGRT
jgi:hypothetical protein